MLVSLQLMAITGVRKKFRGGPSFVRNQL